MASDYWTSTQCNHWLLNHTQLAIARAEDLKYVSNSEEYFAIKIWLVNCIHLLTKRLSLRQRVTATSIIFFHRFYSCSPANSFSSTDPALVATACVYVATKVEETPVHIRNVAQEASKLWSELGYWNFPNDIVTLAEMEFYLLEDLQFHLIVHHPYRSLVAIHTACGKGATKLDFKANTMMKNGLFSSLSGSGSSSISANSTPSTPQPSTDSIIDADLAYGSPGNGLSGKRQDMAKAIGNGEIEKLKQLDKQSQLKVMQEMIDERHRMFLYGGDDSMPLPRIEELDDQVLQMAWFVLNDTYRTDILLLYPPHLIAVASIFLAITLHDATREKMMRSKKWMEERQEQYRSNLMHPKEKRNGNDIMNKSNLETSHSVQGISPNTSSSITSPKATMTTSTSSNSRLPLRGLASLPPKPSMTSNYNRAGASPIASASPAANPVGMSPNLSQGMESSTSLIAAATAAAESNAFDLPIPPPDALTFLAALNVDLGYVGEIVQEMLRLYDLWHRIASKSDSTVDSTVQTIDISDGSEMIKRLQNLRQRRREDLMKNKK